MSDIDMNTSNSSLVTMSYVHIVPSVFCMHYVAHPTATRPTPQQQESERKTCGSQLKMWTFDVSVMRNVSLGKISSLNLKLICRTLRLRRIIFVVDIVPLCARAQDRKKRELRYNVFGSLVLSISFASTSTTLSFDYKVHVPSHSVGHRRELVDRSSYSTTQIAPEPSPSTK